MQQIFNIIYFSGTGNTQYLARRLETALASHQAAVKTHRLERTDPAATGNKGELVLMYPVHGFNAPRNVIRFVRDLPAGQNRTISIISVGAEEHWVNAAASLRLRNILQTKDYVIHQDELLAMPSNFIVGFSDEKCEAIISLAEEKIDQIARSLITGQVSTPEIPFKSKLIAWVGGIESVGARWFGLDLHANQHCTSCGKCVRGCPMNNIRFNKADHPVFSMNCLMCLRCVYQCPENAIHPRLYRFVVLKEGYSISRYRD